MNWVISGLLLVAIMGMLIGLKRYERRKH